MGTLIRYLLLCGALVGLAFFGVTYRIEGQTAFERLKARWAAWDPPELIPEKPAPKKAEKKLVTVQHEPAAAKRVAALRKATRQMKKAPPSKKKTSVERHASPEQKKALDDLVSSRVGRR